MKFIVFPSMHGVTGRSGPNSWEEKPHPRRRDEQVPVRQQGPRRAPRRLRGPSSRSESDGWTFGIIVAGCYPFDGLLAGCRSGKCLRDLLATEETPPDNLEDKRIRNLAEGLLTRPLRYRWGCAQAKEWLSGGDPEVKRGPPGGTDRHRFPGDAGRQDQSRENH